MGSTSFKQKDQSKWQPEFLGFYRDFPQCVAEASSEMDFKGAMVLWKPVGDELIFRIEVSNEAEIKDAVRVWLKAMERYEADSLVDVPMATKGGAFIATFPGPDSESSIPRSPGTETSGANVVDLNDEALRGRDHQKFLFDYFGPSIDTGFRVLSLSTQRHFTISVEVAWAMATVAVDAGLEGSNFIADMAFLGRKPLKGVWGGQEYPVFAIDRESKNGVNVAIRALEGQPLSASAVRDVCQECCKSDKWPSKLYLPKSGHDHFKDVPVNPLAPQGGGSVEGLETVADDVKVDEPRPEENRTPSPDLEELFSRARRIIEKVHSDGQPRSTS